MKKVILATLLSAAMGAVPLQAQEKKDMPMKEGMPMKGEGMQGGGMDDGQDEGHARQNDGDAKRAWAA